jgi:FKBP-type peptidyl-prolyl cis-trans isomerase SlyD
MKIQDDSYVAIDYTLKLDDGKVVDSSTDDEPLSFVFGRNQIIPGVERNIAGLDPGDTAAFTLEATEGYGEVRDELVSDLPRDNFPDDVDLETGMTFAAELPQGPVRFSIAEVKDDAVVADFNHPLAGERLHFDVKIAEVREATQKELAAV